MIGPPAKKAVPDLIRLLGDDQPMMRYLAATALAEIGLQKEEETRRLVGMLTTADADQRPYVQYAVMSLGPDSVPALEKLLSDQDSVAVRITSLQALAIQGGAAKSVVPTVIKLLKHPSDAIRAQSAATLAAIGSDAKDALPTLLENLLDKNVQVQTYSFQASVVIGQDDRRALLSGLKSANAKGRWNAAFVLGNGKSGKAAVPGLIKDLQDKDTGKRVSAVVALGQIGNDAEAAIPALKAMAKEENKQVRTAAQQALAQLDQKNREAYLEKLRRDRASWLKDFQAESAKLNRFLKEQQARLQMQQASLATTKLSVAMKKCAPADGHPATRGDAFRVIHRARRSGRCLRLGARPAQHPGPGSRAGLRGRP